MTIAKIDKYEYFTCNEILTFHQGRMIEQMKIVISLLGKAFKKQTKITERKKQVDA